MMFRCVTLSAFRAIARASIAGRFLSVASAIGIALGTFGVSRAASANDILLSDIAAIAPSIQAEIEDTTSLAFDPNDVSAVAEFYRNRQYAPIWLDRKGLTRGGATLVAEIQAAGEWGLSPSDFVFQVAHMPPPVGGWSNDQAAQADMELTRLALRYANHARGGRISSPPTQLSTYLDRKPNVPKAADVLKAIATAGDSGAVLRSYQPKHDQFLKLKAYLAETRASMARQQDSQLALRGAELRRGDRHNDVVALRRRLSTPAALDSEDVMDDALVAAVKAFQSSSGLRADGVVGRSTRKALNGGNVIDRTQAVIANMEQWRWMPAELGATHAFVNVPSFSVDFITNGVSTFRDRVVVGTEQTQTPIFSHDMSTIVIRPEWNLPDSIKIQKVMAAGGNGRTLESRGYKIRGKNGRVINSSRINWSRADLTKYAIFQPSGSDNALGLVKFLFPNKHSVYLHDTPSKSLFNASTRLFSHGCVRVRNPLVFAQRLLDYDQGAGVMDAARLAKSGPHDNQIELNRSIPVHIGYFTVWIGDDGAPQFLADSYGHQKRITLALSNQWAKINKGKDHLAAIDMTAVKGMIASERRRQAARKSRTNRAYVLLPPSGVTRTFAYPRYQSSGSTVGDMIRRAFAN